MLIPRPHSSSDKKRAAGRCKGS
ncbi:hypothetical protein [Sphingomonas sp. CLY1604]